jgi:N utilization substance protein A
MNREFVEALHHVALERGVAPEVLIQAFEESLVQAYLQQKGYHSKEIKEGLGPTVEAHLDPQRGNLEVLEIKQVVEVVEKPDREISLSQAQEFDPDVEVGEELEFPVDPEEFSQSADRAARNALTQKLKEAERDRVYEEYKDREGQVLVGTVTRTDNRGNIFIDLGRGEALMPQRNQIPRENAISGQRLVLDLRAGTGRMEGRVQTVFTPRPAAGDGAAGAATGGETGN